MVEARIMCSRVTVGHENYVTIRCCSASQLVEAVATTPKRLCLPLALDAPAPLRQPTSLPPRPMFLTLWLTWMRCTQNFESKPFDIALTLGARPFPPLPTRLTVFAKWAFSTLGCFLVVQAIG